MPRCHFKLFFLTASLITTPIALAADPTVFISEFSIGGESVDDDFVEFYNPSTTEISLSGWRLCKRTQGNKSLCESGSTASIKVFTSTEKIPAKGHYLWTNGDGKKYTDLPADTHTKQSLTANNSIALYNNTGNIIDAITWGSGHIAPFIQNPTLTNPISKKSHTRNMSSLLWEENQSPTPTNSHGQTLIPPPKSDPDPVPPPSTPATYDIRINEIFPNPLDEDDEWVELFNSGQDPVSLEGWTLADKTKPYTFIKSDKVEPKGFFVLSRTKSGIALNNTNETLTLSDAVKNTINKISYEKTVENASFNYTEGGYRWSKAITPLAENILNNAPETKKADIPDTAYLDVPILFSASGKDSDGEKIKYTWDFGDGHKSYKQEIAHHYEKKGKYQGTLTISDGTENTVTEFSLEVTEYEAPKVRMISLVPNPIGKDTDTESIEIENRSKKSVDLLGWSVATGWKKLINHPIRESFVIKAKSKRFLTREISSFTLPNEKGKIELRSPDGKPVQKMKYDLKGKSAEENAKIVKEKGKRWEWTAEQRTVNDEPSSAKASEGQSNPPESISPEEKQLQKDTETITLKKRLGEKLVSTEKNPKEEMRKLIGFGTTIETPVAILESVPRVAGAKSESPLPDTDAEDISLNAIINNWLAGE